MATLSITKKFTNPTGHIVANAQEIAYEEGTGGSGALIYDRTVVSVKDKIDALLQSINTNTASIGTIQSAITQIQSTLETLDLDADNVVYSDNVTVKDKLDELAEAINNITQAQSIGADHVTYTPVGSEVQSTVKDQLDALNVGTPSVASTSYANVEEYNADKGTSLTPAEFNSLTPALKMKTASQEATGLYAIKEDVEVYAQEAKNQKTLAQAAASQSAQSLSQVGTAKTNALSEIETAKSNALDVLATNVSKIDSINNLQAAWAQTVSDPTETFILLSQHDYDNLVASVQGAEDGKVYLVYDDSNGSSYCKVTVSANNNIYGSVLGTGVYESGTQFLILASPNSGYLFVGWKANGEPNVTTLTHASESITATSDSTANYVAEFAEIAQTFLILIFPSQYEDDQQVEHDAGTITVLKQLPNTTFETTEDRQLEVGTVLKILATPISHYQFIDWAVPGSSKSISENNPYQFTLSGNLTYVANFEPLPKRTITLQSNGNGSVNTLNETSYYTDEDITITATPDAGYQFEKWTLNGQDTELEANATVNLEVDSVFVAYFTEE